MATREEIREGVAEKLFEWCKRNGYIVASFEWKDVTGATRGLILAITDIVLEYEDSQGVVVKVYGEQPYINCGRNKRQNEAQLDMRDRMLKAGYVATEPLVEE